MLIKRLITALLLVLSAILVIPFSSFGQVEDCIISYGKALELYNTGHFNDALETLTQCLENTEAQKKVSKDTKVEIFRLAALCCLMTGQTELADQYTRKVLTYQPEYKGNPRDDDLAEFTSGINELLVTPKLSIGLSAGTTIPVVNLVDQFSAVVPENQLHSISGKPGIHYRLMTEYTITKTLSVGLEPGYSYNPLDYTVTHTDVEDYSYKLEFAFIEVPVLIKYRYYNKSSFIPHASAGAAGRYMVTSFEKSDDLGNYWLTQDEETNGILSSFLISSKTLGILAGCGVDYQIKNSAITFDVRYVFNMTSSASKSNFDPVSSYDDISNTERVYFTDHIGLITVSCLQVSLGFKYYLNFKVH